MESHAIHVELFQKSGAEANLRYLWSRLAERDLSGTEALAMLGVVHRELGRSAADDPRLYLSYARFMQALQREMPAVHQHVVRTWRENRNSAKSARTVQEPTIEEDAATVEDETLESARENPEPATAPSLRQSMQSVQSDFAHAEGPEEAGEPDDGDTEPGQSRSNQLAGAAGEGDDSPEQEPEEEPEREAREEDLEEPDAQEETAEERELDAPEAAEANAVQESQDEESMQEEAVEQGSDSETEQNAESAEANELNRPESGVAGAEARTGAESASSEATEWPAEERAEPAEALEEFEGDEGAPAPLE